MRYKETLDITHPELLKEWDYEKNEIRPNEITAGSHSKILWKCIFCNCDFQKTISSRIRKGLVISGCASCAVKRRVAASFFTLEEFLSRAKDVHNDEYKYYKVEYKGILVSIEIICEKEGHGSFWQTPNKHLNSKHGCPVCGVIKQADAKRKSLEQFIEGAKLIHNDKYDYSEVCYINNRTPVKVRCKIHDFKFEVRPSAHLQDVGCPKCGKNISKIETEFLNALGIPEKIRNKRINIKLNDKRRCYKPDAYLSQYNLIIELDGDFFHGNLNLYNAEEINPRTGITFGEHFNNTIRRKEILIQDGYNIINFWESEFKEVKIKLQNKKESKFEIKFDSENIPVFNKDWFNNGQCNINVAELIEEIIFQRKING